MRAISRLSVFIVLELKKFTQIIVNKLYYLPFQTRRKILNKQKNVVLARHKNPI